MSLIGNEQAKLTATYLNCIAIALAAVGGIAPWVAFALQPSPTNVFAVALSSLSCFSVSLALHLVALRVLRRLR